jgi:hypothetical protein
MYKSIRALSILLLLLSLPVTLLTNCSTAPQRSSRSTADLKTYVSLDLEYPRYKNILEQLVKKVGPLQNRGEAHITVITPPEFTKLTDPVFSKLNAVEIHNLFNNAQINKNDFNEICIAEGSLKNTNLKTYFIVVQSEKILEFRRKIAHLAQTSKDKFDADLFFPHITLGFTERDLHFQDGVIKDIKLCMKNIDIQL